MPRAQFQSPIPLIRSKTAKFKARSAQDWLKPIQADRNEEIGGFGANPEGNEENSRILRCFVVDAAFSCAFLLSPRLREFSSLSGVWEIGNEL